MQRVRIKLPTPELIAEFIDICSKYECDINLYDGSVISSFINDMRKFEV